MNPIFFFLKTAKQNEQNDKCVKHFFFNISIVEI